jgi:hypothetical protein
MASDGIDDFEAGLGDWSVEGGVWALGSQQNANEPAAESGDYQMGTVIGGHYGAGRDALLISPAYPVPPASESPRFRFSYWHRMATGDYGQVQVRMVGGEWQNVEGGLIDQINGSWSQQLVDLRPYEGETVQIGLRFVSAPQTTGEWGWYVDNAGFETAN